MNELTIHADFTALDAMLRRLRKEEKPVRIVHDGVEYSVSGVRHDQTGAPPGGSDGSGGD